MDFSAPVRRVPPRGWLIVVYIDQRISGTWARLDSQNVSIRVAYRVTCWPRNVSVGSRASEDVPELVVRGSLLLAPPALVHLPRRLPTYLSFMDSYCGARSSSTSWDPADMICIVCFNGCEIPDNVIAACSTQLASDSARQLRDSLSSPSSWFEVTRTKTFVSRQEPCHPTLGLLDSSDRSTRARSPVVPSAS